jgi:hypothetical protein
MVYYEYRIFFSHEIFGRGGITRYETANPTLLRLVDFPFIPVKVLRRGDPDNVVDIDCFPSTPESHKTSSQPYKPSMDARDIDSHGSQEHSSVSKPLASNLEGHQGDTSPSSSTRPSLSRRSCDVLNSRRATRDTMQAFKSVTYWSGVSLIVGNQIGAGIFGSPALVNGNVGSVGMSLVVWIAAGVLTWTGAGTSLDLFQFA